MWLSAWGLEEKYRVILLSGRAGVFHLVCFRCADTPLSSSDRVCLIALRPGISGGLRAAGLVRWKPGKDNKLFNRFFWAAFMLSLIAGS